MSIDIEKAKKLNDLISLKFKKRHKIVLDPDDRSQYEENSDEDIIYDKGEWNIPEEFNSYIQELSADDQLTTEDKILKVFEKVCTDYIYDDNLISYIKKVDDDVFYVPKWYGQEVDEEWEKNRETHNRRVCFELSRYLTKALTELLKNNDDYNICIYWNEDLTHYITGLTCDDYSITLDTDDFFNIKDLTRLKTGLTAEGINILEDKDDKFKKALDRFNEGRSKYSTERMDNDIKELGEEENPIEENEDITYLKKALEILTKKYDLDSQGIFEYMKELVDIKFSYEREKVWKRIEGETPESTRYVRCLVVNIDNEKIMIDGEDRTIRPLEEQELTEKKPLFVKNKELTPRGEHEYYDGR